MELGWWARSIWYGDDLVKVFVNGGYKPDTVVYATSVGYAGCVELVRVPV